MTTDSRQSGAAAGLPALPALPDLPALPAPGEKPLPSWPGDVVDTGRHRLFVRRAPGPAGGGEPALFVHGLGGSSTNWTDLMALLGVRLDGEAPDLPGFGRSDPPPGGLYPVKIHVDAVVDYLETSGRGPVHLFGNSLGGAVTTRVAAERPDLVRTLTLVSPALPNFRPQRGSDPRLPLLLLPGLRPLVLRSMSRTTPEQRAWSVINYCFADPSLIHPDRIAEAVAEVVRRRELAWVDDALIGSLRGLIASYVVTGSSAIWRLAAGIRLPVLVVHGSVDRLVPVSVAERARRVFPDVRVMILPDVGHVAQMERPYAVAEAFLRMVLENAPSGP